MDDNDDGDVVEGRTETDGPVEDTIKELTDEALKDKRNIINNEKKAIKALSIIYKVASVLTYGFQGVLVLFGATILALGEIEGLKDGQALQVMASINLLFGSILAALTTGGTWLKSKKGKKILNRKELISKYVQLVGTYEQAMSDGVLDENEVTEIIKKL